MDPSKVVQFSVRMKSRARHELEAGQGDGELAIRIQGVTKSVIEECALPEGTQYVWGIVRTRRGMPDTPIVGGPAESVTSAEARARQAFADLEEKWAARRAREVAVVR